MRRIGRGRVGRERRGPDDHVRFGRRIPRAPAFHIEEGATGGTPTGSGSVREKSAFELFHEAVREYVYQGGGEKAVSDALYKLIVSGEIKGKADFERIREIVETPGFLPTLANRASSYRSSAIISSPQEFEREYLSDRDFAKIHHVEDLLHDLFLRGASKQIRENESMVEMAVHNASCVSFQAKENVIFGRLFNAMLSVSKDSFSAAHDRAIDYIARAVTFSSPSEPVAQRKRLHNLMQQMNARGGYAIQQNFLDIPPGTYGIYWRRQYVEKLRHYADKAEKMGLPGRPSNASQRENSDLSPMPC